MSDVYIPDPKMPKWQQDYERARRVGHEATKEGSAQDLWLRNQRQPGITNEEFIGFYNQIQNGLPPELLSRAMTNRRISKQLNIPLEEVMANPAYFLNQFGIDPEKVPQDQWYNAVSKAFTRGEISMEINGLWSAISVAEDRGDTATVEHYKKLIAEYEKEREQYIDPWADQRFLLTKGIVGAAESTRYMLYITGATIAGSMVAPGVGTVAGFLAGWKLNRDSEYGLLREAGVNHENAKKTSLWVGALQSAIEIGIGRSIGKIAMKFGAPNIPKIATDKVLNAVFQKIRLTGVPYTIAKFSLGNIAEAVGEGTEEVLQALASRKGLLSANGIQMAELEKALANPESAESKALLSMAQDVMLEDSIRQMALTGALETKAQLLGLGVEIEYGDDFWNKDFVGSLFKEFEGGILSGLVLRIAGLPIETGYNAIFNGKFPFQQAKALRDEARANPSKADFLEKTEESGIPKAVRENTWEAMSSVREREEAALLKEARERGGLGTGMEERPAEGEELKKEYRTSKGRLFIQDDQRKGKGNARTGIFKFGDGGKTTKTNLYGFIDYRIDGKKLTVRNMEVVPHRRELTDEFYSDFARAFNEADYDIQWNPENEALAELRDDLVQKNPRGAEAGLNWFEKDSGVSLDDQQTGQKTAEQFRAQDPTITPQKMNLINRMVHSIAKTNTENNNISLADSWRALHFDPDNLFTDKIEPANAVEYFLDEKARPHWGEVGVTEELIDRVRRGEAAFTPEQMKHVHDNIGGFITQLKKDAVKYIYLGKHGNFSTLVHEVAHAARAVLRKDLLMQAEAALGVKNGKWTRANEEDFARQYEQFCLTGKVADQRLKTVFEKIRDFMIAVYKGIEKIVKEENPELYKVFETMLQHIADETAGAGQETATARQEGAGKASGYTDTVNGEKAAPGASSTRTEGISEADGYNDIEAWVETLPEENRRLYWKNKALNESRESLDKNNAKEDPKPVIEGVEDLEGLKAKAREGHDFIRDLADKWARKWDDGAKGRRGFEAEAVLKSDERAVEKHEEEDTPYNEMLDMVGFTVVVNDFKTLLEMAKEVCGDEAVVRVKDRYRPGKDIAGYRDILLNVKAPNGFIGEIQLNVEQMYEAKETYGGHALYEARRSVDTEVKKGNLSEEIGEKDKAILYEISEKFHGKAEGLVYAAAQASASSLDIRSPSFSVYESKNGEGDKVLSEFTANNLNKLVAQALSRHLTNRSEGSSKSGTLGDAGAKSSGFPLNNVSAMAGTSASSIGQSTGSVNTQNEDFQKIQQNYRGAKRTEGAEDTKYLGEEELEGRWVLVEAETPTASHDETTFTETAGFPTRNDRDYRNDKAAQAAVRTMGGGFDGRALEGIVISKDGVVISGNNRTMSGKLAARNNTDGNYVEALAKKARKYGFTEAQVREFAHPRLVFETEVSEYSTDLMARFNQSTMKAMTPLETAVKMSKRLAEKPGITRKIAGTINEHESLTELYNDKKAVMDIFKTLKDAGFIGEYELPQYLSEEGAITGAGEDLIESVMLGAVLTEDVNRGLQESKDLRRKLVRGITPLMENKGMGDYSLAEEVKEAAGVVIQVKRGNTYKSVDDYANQQILPGVDITPAKRASIQIAQALESGGQRDFHDWMEGLNTIMAVAAAGQQDMFGSGVESKEAVLDRYVRWFDVKESAKKQNNKIIRDTEATLTQRAEAAADNAAIAVAETMFQMGRYDPDENPIEYLQDKALGLRGEAERERILAEIGELARLYPPETNRYLAPNGKASGLNHAQWYAVRTGNFKEWFGDWEAAINAEWVFNAEPVKQLEGTEFSKSETDLITQVNKFFKSIGGKVEREGLGVVDLTRRGVKDSIAHGIGRMKAAAFTAVPDVIRHGKIIDYQTNWKGRGYDTCVIDAPITIGNVDYIAEVIINQDKDGQRFYLHEVEIKEKAQSAFKTGMDTGAPQASKLIITRKLQEVKGKVSKIVDENGEPQAVYHGTDKRFDIFKTANNWGYGGAYFNTNRNVAHTYAQGNTIYDVFANLRNPFIADAENRHWDSIPRPKEMPGSGPVDTQEIVRFARNNGYDGVMVNNVQEHGGIGTDVITFEPNQIKSATDNAGTFDPDNPSTLFQPAYQGSPYVFDRYDNSNVGSVLGNLRYGWGHTFYSRKEAAEWLAQAMSKYKGAEGNLYEVELPDDHNLLHWEKPMSEQPEAVQRAADRLIAWNKDDKSNFNKAYNLRQFDDDTFGFYRSINGKMKWATVEEAQAAAKEEIKKTLTGKEFYNTLAERVGAKRTSLLLDHLGVKGAKYFDESTEKVGVPGGYNYVIYGDSDIEIMGAPRAESRALVPYGTLFQISEVREDLTVTDENLTQGQAVERLKALANTDLTNLETGITAQINTTQRDKLVSNTAVQETVKNGFTKEQHYAAAAKIDKLWKHAVQIEDRADRGGDVNIKSIKRFAAPLRFSNETAYANILVKESVEQGHRIYTVELQEINRLRAMVSTLEPEGERIRSRSLIYQKIARLADIVNSDSAPQTFFQLNDLLEEAAEYESWEEFRDSQQEGNAASAADNAWYQSFWKDAKKVCKTETLFQDNAAEEADEAFMGELSNEVIDEAVRQIYNYAIVEAREPAEGEERAAYTRAREMRDKLGIELPDRQKWLTRAVKIAGGKELSKEDYAYLRGLVRKSKRDYRAIFADLLGRDEWKKNLAEMKDGEPHAKLADPRRKHEKTYSEERLERIAERVSDPELAREIREGAVKIDDARIQAFSDGIEEGIRQGEEAVQNLKKETDAEYGRLAEEGGKQLAELYREFQAAAEKVGGRQYDIERKRKRGELLTERYQRETQQLEADYESLYRQLLDMGRAHGLLAEVREAITKQEAVQKERQRVRGLQRERMAIREMREIKKRLVKSAMRKTGPGVSWAQARTIKIIQSLLAPSLEEGVHDWMKGLDTPSIMELHHRYWTDQEFQDKLRKKVNPRRLEKLERILSKPFDTLTDQELQDIVKALPKANWVQELGLEKLISAMEDSLPRHERDRVTGHMKIGEEEAALAREALGEVIYSRLLNIPFASWSVMDMAELNEVIGDLYAEGRQNERARLEVRLARSDKYCDQILKLIKTAHIKEGASPEEIKKILNKYGKDKYGNVKKNSWWTSFYDADVRRFSTALGGGIMTDLLYRMEDDCFINKERGEAARKAGVNRIMEKEKISITELEQWIEIKDFWGKGLDQCFTVDDLLFFRRAVMNDFSRKAITYGNFAKPAEREGFKRMGGDDGLAAFGDLAGVRLEKVLKAAGDFLNKAGNDKFVKLADAIGRDYDINGPRLLEAAVKMFNQPITIEQYYVRMYRLDSTGKATDAEQMRDLLGQTGIGQKAVNKGQTKERQHISPFHQTPIETGLYKTWLKGVEADEHLIAYGQYVQTLNSVFNGVGSGEMISAIQDRYGEAAVNYIKEYINELANPNPKVAKGWDSFVRTLRGKTATAYLAWRLVNIMKQAATSPWPYLQEIKPDQYIAACLKLARDYKGITAFIKQKSMLMNNRVADPMFQIIKEEAGKTTNPAMSRIDQFNRKGMKGLEVVDWACVAPGWLAVYEREYVRLSKELDQKISERTAELVKEGLAQDQAAQRAARETKNDIDREAVYLADDTVQRLQPQARKLRMAPMFKGRGKAGETGAALLQFQAAFSPIWQNIKYDLPEAVRNKQWMKIAGMATSWAMAGICLGLLSELGDDDDDKERRKALRWLFYATSQMTDSAPIIGNDITKLVERKLTGRRSQYGNTSFLPVVIKALTGLENIPGLFDEDPKKREKAFERVVKNLGSAGMLVTGLPLSTTRDIGRAAGAWDGKPGLHFNPWPLINGEKP